MKCFSIPLFAVFSAMAVFAQTPATPTPTPATPVAKPGVPAAKPGLPPNVSPSGTHRVYLLPMAGGLDQFLAEQLTSDHIMQVVADPKTADVVLTDRLGEAFERKLVTIHPRDEDDDDDAEIHPGFRSSTIPGTIFLVDFKSRHVLWSDYEKPSRTNSRSTLKRAARVAKKLNETFAR